MSNQMNKLSLGKDVKKISIESDEEYEEDYDYMVDITGTIYQFSAKTLTGDDLSFLRYKGSVCLIVNIAFQDKESSSQFKELMEIYTKSPRVTGRISNNMKLRRN
ncbi:uncharacterized protein LOC108732800 [Agrilus planipennis]|uniref:Uncharacterized protein LOC108732800 n=1 Tax=Agrilus planipennis TaxID=224129 RepID=A0A1W4WGN2_AGRPL|nr:uncharacterized protein LOC108732800 [Agrilus planipennis]